MAHLRPPTGLCKGQGAVLRGSGPGQQGLALMGKRRQTPPPHFPETWVTLPEALGCYLPDLAAPGQGSGGSWELGAAREEACRPLPP